MADKGRLYFGDATCGVRCAYGLEMGTNLGKADGKLNI